MTPTELTVALGKIRLLALDVDGVMSDGGVYYSDQAAEMKRFHIHDGLGIVLAGFVGLQIAWITGRRSSIVERRARELGVSELHQGVRNKARTLALIVANLGIQPDEVAFMGDDLNDLPALRVAAVAIAPANATSLEVRESVHFVTARSGGNGAVRDAVEAILRARGDWDTALGAYLASLSEPEAISPTQ